MIKTKFSDHKYANACIIECKHTGKHALLSYNTIVIASTPDYINRKMRHVIKGLYTPTTRKHIGWYAKAHNLEYSHFKWAYEHNADIIQDYETNKIIFQDNETGEILKII